MFDINYGPDESYGHIVKVKAVKKCNLNGSNLSAGKKYSIVWTKSAEQAFKEEKIRVVSE